MAIDLRARRAPCSRRHFVAASVVSACHARAARSQTLLAEPDRKAALVLDADDESLLHAHKINALRYPASLTKVMTLYGLFDELAAGTILLSDRIVVSKHAALQPQTRLGLLAGSLLPVETAIGAVSIRSANDAAVAVAERLGGSEARFSAWMCIKARLLGMRQTHFVNATGLPDPYHVSTAHDLGLLAIRIWAGHARYCDRFGHQSHVWNGRSYPAHTAIARKIEGIVGAKTGYTHASGYNLMVWAEREGRRLVAVVLGEGSAEQRDQFTAHLVETAFARPSVRSGAPVVRK